jgi:hypothetical protein
MIVPVNVVTVLWQPLHSTGAPALVIGTCRPRVDISTGWKLFGPLAPAKVLPSEWQVLHAVPTSLCSAVMSAV